MSGVDALLLVAASVLLLLGHFARALRWGLLFPRDHVKRFNLLVGLGLGYAVNALIPFRLGELLRAYYVSLREQVRLGYIGGTVLAERVSDLFAVGIVAAVLGLAGMQPSVPIVTVAFSMLAFGALAVAFAFLLRASRDVRRLVWWVASAFNDRVRFALVDFVWSFSELIAAGTLLKPRFLLATLGMWILYGAAYLVFGAVAGENIGSTLYAVFGTPLRSLADYLLNGSLDRRELAMFLFTVLPLLGILGYGMVRQGSVIRRLVLALRFYGGTPADRSPPQSRNRFKREAEYEYFLASLFSGDDHVVTGFGLRAVEDGLVHKLFNGGSDAITALVEVDDRLLIRKFALGVPGRKLKVQADWLKAHRHDQLSLVDVVGERDGESFYRYDMPLVVPTADLYDAIHTTPLANSKALLEQVTARVAAFHDLNSGPDADPKLIAAYLEQKGSENARKILDFVRTMLPDEKFEINGTPHDLGEWECLLDPGWLAQQVTDRRTSTIHGDLTIENIIVSPDRPEGWFIIDPNPENVFDSPLIDWAKLMQSLHLGYETLNRGVLCTVNGASISLGQTKSHAYSALHSHYEAILERAGGPERLREVYFHELMHYLRLTPYKIRQDAAKGLTFFACTCLLLRRYREMAL
ncbi:lysylphosphatidylglycerol synthase transmembrane domain-containing protein [Devosia sp. 1566]|uniref:lysylphosphatidylglycerol synthase transmembrane domain-containing protein n=1 Tax=Devosia sp. 1566 TaxID=2499144 RepID=UPI000FDA06A2|nr:lysylphosphatidylglycerol synthase transmembrane domain-containing protein [Devosia sp. 1566]